jgi:hypothetical protein
MSLPLVRLTGRASVVLIAKWREATINSWGTQKQPQYWVVRRSNRARADSPGCNFLYRRFLRFFGGGGGGLAALTSSGVGTAGAGINRWIVYCWPIVQKLVVIQ